MTMEGRWPSGAANLISVLTGGKKVLTRPGHVAAEQTKSPSSLFVAPPLSHLLFQQLLTCIWLWEEEEEGVANVGWDLLWVGSTGPKHNKTKEHAYFWRLTSGRSGVKTHGALAGGRDRASERQLNGPVKPFLSFRLSS